MRPQFNSWVRKIPWKRDRLPTPVFLGFPCGSGGKESTCNAADLGLIPGLGRSPGEGKGYPLQYFGLENHGVTKSWTQLSNFHFTFTYYNWRGSLVAQTIKNPPAMQETWVWSLGQENLLEKGKAHPLQYSCLENSMDRGAGRLQSTGSQRVWHDRATNVTFYKSKSTA